MQNFTKFLVSFFVFLLSITAGARTWKKIDIPGAICGGGKPYSVFIERRDFDKLLIEIMGGGACWDNDSCYGAFALTTLEPRKSVTESALMKDTPNSPWIKHSALYLPYCTGDVHAGQHVAQYRQNVDLHHNGYNNILLTLQYLHQQNLIDFQRVQDVTVWGASAGAIGALVHAHTIASYLSPTARKTLISDSPGLHFGKSFWTKFSKAINYDFKMNFGHMGLFYSLDDGFLAPHMGPVFEGLQGWSVGIMQSTRDTIMSLVFGNILPSSHEKLVLGPQGVAAVGSRYPHVKVWITAGSQHTFLLDDKEANTTSMEKEKAYDFAVRVYNSPPVH